MAKASRVFDTAYPIVETFLYLLKKLFKKTLKTNSFDIGSELSKLLN